MIFHKTPLQDAYLIELNRLGDNRGFFARAFCQDEFAEHGLETQFVQMNNSLTATSGTLRGFHYQTGDSAEVKVVRAIRGKLYDAIIDLRPDSPTFKQSFGAELNDENRLMMYVPRGFAHCILTLTDDVEAMYMVSNRYDPGAERGVRWNDSELSVKLPITPVEISEKDAAWPDFDPEFHAIESLRGKK